MLIIQQEQTFSLVLDRCENWEAAMLETEWHAASKQLVRILEI